MIRFAIAALLAVSVYLAAKEPCTSAEAVVYERYASRNYLEMWRSPLDARLGVVYGALSRMATRLGGVSELTIRIPAILGGLLFWIELAAVLPNTAKPWSFLIVAANPWTFRAFSTVSGSALAVGLCALAIVVARKRPGAASLVAWLAIGSDWFVAVPVLAAASVVCIAMKYGFWKWVDELLLPGVLAGLLFFFPALLNRERPAAVSRDDRGMRELVKTIPRTKATERVAVGAALEPGLFFYRRRLHLDWIQIVKLDADADYYVLGPTDRSATAMPVIKVTPGATLAAR